MQLNIPKQLRSSEFNELRCQFTDADDVSILLPDNLSAEEIRDMTLFLLSQESDDFRNSLIADLVEYDCFPRSLLEKVFEKGDIGCRVAVCLRDDLSKCLQELCEKSDEVDVRNHFINRKAFRDNKY